MFSPCLASLSHKLLQRFMTLTQMLDGSQRIRYKYPLLTHLLIPYLFIQGGDQRLANTEAAHAPPPSTGPAAPPPPLPQPQQHSNNGCSTSVAAAIALQTQQQRPQQHSNGIATAASAPAGASPMFMLMALQRVKPLLDRLHASKEVRWAMGQDFSRMSEQQLGSLLDMLSKSQDDAASLLMLQFFFPDCGL